MTCPHCKLENPPTAQRCDCGYDFESRGMKGSYLDQARREKGISSGKPSTFVLFAGWALAALGGLGAIFIARHIVYAKHLSDPTAYRYDEPSRSHGRILFGVSVAMTIMWLIVRAAARA